MSDDKSKLIPPEIIIGLVSPLGCAKDIFIEQLTKYFEKKGYEVVPIVTTKILYEKPDDYSDFCESFKLFVKMELCNLLRRNYKGSVASILINNIVQLSNKGTNSSKGRIYLIDQLKNEAESDILNHVYGLNYIQLSLFSNNIVRDKNIKDRIKNDSDKKIKKMSNRNIIDAFVKEELLKKEIEKSIFSINLKNKEEAKKNGLKYEKYNIYELYRKNIRSDSAHNLIEKDYIENSSYHKDSGQQISKLFHKSHYYFNLDIDKTLLNNEIEKFILQLFGQYKDYPTQDEFGMALAYHASYRSNFPHERHIGAAIIADGGEVISAGSIRAPNKSSNTKLKYQDSITEGYNEYKNNIKEWIKSLDESNLVYGKEISLYLNDSIDFHPCTHAEMSALLDAAKLGVSVKGATIYTTTFPCHLCAKDIITAGISRVVYIEAYPKSKSKDLYPKIIDLNSQNSKELIPFDLFFGVSPSRYHYVYALKNKKDYNLGDYNISPYLLYECADYYKKREEDVCMHFCNYLNDDSNEALGFLDGLMKDH